MNSEREQLQHAKEYSQRGDAFESEGNYEFAGKCYAKVAMMMKELQKNSKKPEMAQILSEKVKKYESLEAEMLVKNEEKKIKVKKVQLSKFGFPETKKDIVSHSNNHHPVKQKATVTHNHPKKGNKKVEIDKDVQSLIIHNIEITFEDIVGMEQAKEILYESVIIPQKRPDLFEGIRSPPRGILMYGPPGNGKTFIAKALAKQSKCTFYNISAASIMNKLVGQSEKMLRKVFVEAQKTSPSIIFIDQIDSMLTSRSQNENEVSRRLKTQFLVQFDGVTTSKESHVIVIGATNLPNEIDLAVLRRFNKLVYIGLPNQTTRQSLVLHNLKEIAHEINKKEVKKVGKMLQGYSNSQIRDIVKEACMEPIRELNKKIIETVTKSSLRKVEVRDFENVLKQRKPLLTKQDLKKYDAKFH